MTLDFRTGNFGAVGWFSHVFTNFKRVHEACTRASWPQGCHGGIEEMRQEPRELSKQFGINFAPESLVR